MAVELGLNQDSKELRMLGKFLKEKGATEAFQEIVGREMTGKSQEEQATFMSAGMDSLKEMVNGLMEIKKQTRNSSEMEAEVNELWSNFLNGTEADKKAIRAFIEQANLAKREAWTNLGLLHTSQDDLDKANKFRSRADRVKSSTDPDKYRFTSMAGGPVRKFLSVISRFPGAVPRRLAEVFSNSDKNDEAYETNLSVELRAKILTTGDTSQVLEMWRNGVLSTNELGDLRKKLITELADDSKTKQLNEDETDALENNKELKKFTNESGVFVKADRNVQAKHFQDFFQQKQDLALENYKKSQNKYIGFDFDNAENWEKVLMIGAVNIDIILPEWFKKAAVPMANKFGKGILTFGEDIGKEVGFVVDNMEGMIANSALEDLSSSAVAREMAVENLLKLLNSPEEVDPKEVAKAAEVLRGAESALTRAAMMVARATDTVSITQDKGLALSAILSPIELASAGLDAATGGIMFRKNVGELLKELKVRSKKLLDGKAALGDVTERLLDRKGEDERKAFVAKVTSTEDERMDDKISKSNIPEQYMERDSMDQHVNRSIFSRTAESMRKLVGPDTWLAKNSQAWKTLTEGSKRQSVDEVVEATNKNRKMAAIGVELVKEKLLAAEAGVERSMLAVQEATLLSYKNAQEDFTNMELRQILERSKLDKMWENVLMLGAVAAGAAVALAAATGLEAISGSWVDAAGASFGKASAELEKMLEGLPKIIETAKEYGLPRAQAGAEKDIRSQNWEVIFKQAKLSLAEFNQIFAPRAKDILSKVMISLPLLAAGRASWNLMPGNRAISNFMKADRIDKVNVV